MKVYIIEWADNGINNEGYRDKKQAIKDIFYSYVNDIKSGEIDFDLGEIYKDLEDLFVRNCIYSYGYIHEVEVEI